MRRIQLVFAFSLLVLDGGAGMDRGHAWAVGASARSYRNEAMRVRAFEPPPGWELAPQPSYTRLLASYTHAGGRLTLSAQRVQATTHAQALVEQSLSALARQGFAEVHVTADGDRVRLEALLDGGKRFVKQLYLVDGGIAYVITLIAPQASAPAMLRDFEDAVRSLLLGGPTEPGAVR